ncbi:MAG: hypothetical protein ACM3YE_15770, partial [Bacteroidota bacterium]
PFINHFYHTLLLTGNEIKRNAPAWLAPLPVLLGTIWWSSRSGWRPISLNTTWTWTYLLSGIILIMVYGLQSFSSEADRKTLDFIINKPLASSSIICAKYLTGLAVFWCWFSAFSFLVKPNLDLLNLPKGIGPEWLILVLLTVHAVSFFSGLLARGLERFMVITVLSLIMASGAYFLWNKIFTLITVNFLWFDIPPRLLFLLEKLLPIYLAVLSLLAPLIGVYWSLKSKVRLWRFKPALCLIGVWLLTLFVVELTQFLFAPLVWPDRNGKSGDWHPEKGIVLAGLKQTPSKSGPTGVRSYLSINRAGHKPQIIYTGANLYNPRFSPDGHYLVFSENNRLKILDLAMKTTVDIGEGQVATWSEEGTKLITAKKVSPKGLSLLYLVDLKNSQTRQLTPEQFEITDLIWDCRRDKLYMFSLTDQLHCLDLKDNSVKELHFPDNDKPKFFGVVKPSIRYIKEKNLVFIGQVFARTIKIYHLSLETQSVGFAEEKSDFRILTNGPLLFNQEGTAYLWPRIDGGFVYQATYYDPDHEHDHYQDHEHEHDHYQESDGADR